MIKSLVLTNFKKYRRLLFSLAIGMFLFQLLMAGIYDSMAPYFAAQNQINEGVGGNLETLNAFTGGADMFSPAGWLAVGYAHPIPIILLLGWIVAVSGGAIAKEIEDGTSEMLFTRPIRRSRVLGARMLHLSLGALIILSSAYLGTAVGMTFSQGLSSITQTQILKMLSSFFPLGLVLASVGCLASAYFSQKSVAVSIASGFAIIMYVLNFAGQLWEPLSGWIKFSIFYHTVPANWGDSNINLSAILMIIGLSVLSLALAFKVLSRRNIIR
jgi:ABC-2 type transport system permease protein